MSCSILQVKNVALTTRLALLTLRKPGKDMYSRARSPHLRELPETKRQRIWRIGAAVRDWKSTVRDRGDWEGEESPRKAALTEEERGEQPE